MSYARVVRTLYHIAEDGHTDVSSMRNKVNNAYMALEKMKDQLDKLSDKDSLPTWWTNKVAVAVNDLDKAADYMSADGEDK